MDERSVLRLRADVTRFLRASGCVDEDLIDFVAASSAGMAITVKKSFLWAFRIVRFVSLICYRISRSAAIASFAEFSRTRKSFSKFFA